MAEQEKPCLSHGVKWRCHFQFVLNRLRASLIPVKYSYLFASLLCECDLKKDKFSNVWDVIPQEEVACSHQRLQAHLHNEVDSEIKNCLNSQRFSRLSLQIPQLNNTCDQERRLSNFQVSILRLFYLLDKAFEFDFKLLDSVLIEIGGYFDKKQTPKEDSSTTFQLNEFDKSDIPYLIGKRGVCLRAFLKEHKCRIRLECGGSDFILVTVFKRGTENKERIERIFTEFCELAKAIKKLNEIKRQNFISMRDTWYSSRARKVQWRAEGNAVDATGNVSAHKLANGQVFKEQRKRFYETKVLRHRSDYENSKPVKSVLDRGRCLQCLKPFTELRDTSLCVHHPGFIVRTRETSYWSCCEKLCEDLDQTFESHINTGCEEVRTHNWRVNKKSSQGAQKQAVRKLNTKIPDLPSGVESGEALAIL